MPGTSTPTPMTHAQLRRAIKPRQTIVFDFEADNPGQWLTHCHNAYHAEAGMMGVFSYIH